MHMTKKKDILTGSLFNSDCSTDAVGRALLSSAFFALIVLLMLCCEVEKEVFELKDISSLLQ